MVLPVVVVVGVALWGYMDATGGVGAGTVWNYTWPGVDGGTRGGYLVGPVQALRSVSPDGDAIPAVRSGDGRVPAVLLLHHDMGLTLEIARLAERLAVEGYIVLAPDLFRGERAVSVPGALVLGWTHRGADIAVDLELAFGQLAALPEVDSRRVAVAGLAFGGTEAVRAGIRSNAPALIASISGKVPVVEGDDVVDEDRGGRGGQDGGGQDGELGKLRQGRAFFGAFGRDDPGLRVDEVVRFGDRLRRYGGVVAINIYDSVGLKGFTSGRPGASPDSRRVWRDFRQFLADNL